jgi:hypothetical protein
MHESAVQLSFTLSTRHDRELGMSWLKRHSDFNVRPVVFTNL